MQTTGSHYLRMAALGDSATFGIGDPVPGGWRGWSRLLADALGTSYDVSFCNAAVSGATAAGVRADQVADAVAHRPDLASLVVGLNDTMRSTWDPARLREDLMTCAEALHRTGAVVLTVRFHDHAAVLPLPGVLRRPMAARIGAVNEVYDEIHSRFGGLRLDLGAMAEVHAREFWSVDRLHPSERGHRALARGFGELLVEAGLEFALPDLEPSGGIPPSWRRDLAWVAAAGAPWVGRRARDLGPLAVRLAWNEARRAPEPAR